MAIYLNTAATLENYKELIKSKYFIDKSRIIENFKHHEYFFRQKFSKYKINDKLKNLILRKN